MVKYDILTDVMHTAIQKFGVGNESNEYFYSARMHSIDQK